MSVMLRFSDPRALRDLATFLGRAARVEESETRLQMTGGVLAVWVPVLRPQTILDDSPLVLGMRAVPAVCDEPELDAIVPLRGVLDRLARTHLGGDGGEDERASLSVPPERLLAAWASQSPPRSAWRPVGRVAEQLLTQVAEAGIERVARVVPEGLGTPLVERVRTDTWTQPLIEDAGEQIVPVSGVAFAMHALGFLGAGREDEQTYANIALAPGWLRVTTQRGHVLQRYR